MINIESDWAEILKDEFEKPYFKNLMASVENEYKNKTVYPPQERIFRALECTPYKNVKAVILGQDPYHGENQANGIAFAVNGGEDVPPSLFNILTEIKRDINKECHFYSNLLWLAKEGVLLLNTTLTVRAKSPQSHSSLGWQIFTDEIIRKLNEKETPLVFMLWGANAKAKYDLIDSKKHLVLTSVHPSPLSAHRGFMGCSHFSKANEFLIKNNLAAIDWTNLAGFK